MPAKTEKIDDSQKPKIQNYVADIYYSNVADRRSKIFLQKSKTKISKISGIRLSQESYFSKISDIADVQNRESKHLGQITCLLTRVSAD